MSSTRAFNERKKATSKESHSAFSERSSSTYISACKLFNYSKCLSSLGNYRLDKSTRDLQRADAVAIAGGMTVDPTLTELTADEYPEVERNKEFRKPDINDVEYFRSFLSDEEVLASQSLGELVAFNQDWRKEYRGQSRLILLPDSTHKVSTILKYCNEKKLAVVPQGGNTGLVGGSVPVFDEIILSLKRMNKIREFDPVSGTFKCDAGVIMRDAHQFLANHDHIFPLDLPSRNSCQVGGVVSTNAGGLNLVRYGSLHGNVLGLEVVLPDGQIVSNINSLRKNNTGYDLKQLFIGAEGTIGVITGVSILSAPKPEAFNAVFMGISNFDLVQELFVKAKKELSEILSAFEFMDRSSIEYTIKYLKGYPFPLNQEHNFYILAETSGSNNKHDFEKLSSYLSSAVELKLASEGVIAQNSADFDRIWTWRKSIPPACNSSGGMFQFDISLPLSKLYSVPENLVKKLKEANLAINAPDPIIETVSFGHVGDGNIHLCVAKTEYTKSVKTTMEQFVYEYIASQSGAISAEHGIGFHKKDDLHYSRSDIEIKLMREIKRHYDPNGILNPYKYISA